MSRREEPAVRATLRAQSGCLTCGHEVPRRRRGRPRLYCSSRCERRSPRGDRRACAHCRRTFVVPRDEPTSYCSRSCAWTARPWMRQAAPRRCAWSACGALFRPVDPRARFHALACRRAHEAYERRTDPEVIERRRAYERERWRARVALHGAA
jgi:hypothetical protein